MDASLINDKQNEDMPLITASVTCGVKRNKEPTGRQCDFCVLKTEHYVNGCPKRDYHKVNEDSALFTEYNMNSADDRSHLSTEIGKKHGHNTYT